MSTHIHPHEKPTEFKNNAERLRVSKLYNDPMVSVLEPSVVQCRRCDSVIRLSRSVSYDLSHWKTHRTRCSKRNVRLVDRRPAAKKSTAQASTMAKTAVLGSLSRNPSRASPASNYTPSATSESGESVSVDESPSPPLYISSSSLEHASLPPLPGFALSPIPSSLHSSPQCDPDPAFRLKCSPDVEQYLKDAHGINVVAYPNASWTTWDPSMLRRPNLRLVPPDAGCEY
ncbi:hypothetical protein CYLTODRAFT_419660 [Cylindrobasidium torrendii FP15055 ss-10]|uniref:Uncharacterized protein n=1 Tax=Cylindrobasidium torrendii FP15055 ss-10 TaxID=1314674 RepID=A0A0D7BKC3_9AGAR|nr:hypothetical protein CYLTODRAFT_419660 [Cylindrobasidium torrendii FP15055 ss-10]